MGRKCLQDYYRDTRSIGDCPGRPAQCDNEIFNEVSSGAVGESDIAISKKVYGGGVGENPKER